MIILSPGHLTAAFRKMRHNRGLSQAQLAERLHVTTKAIGYRESDRCGLPADVVLDTAHAFGYVVALIPQRHPGARPTGTGWPA